MLYLQMNNERVYWKWHPAHGQREKLAISTHTIGALGRSNAEIPFCIRSWRQNSIKGRHSQRDWSQLRVRLSIRAHLRGNFVAFSDNRQDVEGAFVRRLGQRHMMILSHFLMLLVGVPPIKLIESGV